MSDYQYLEDVVAIKKLSQEIEKIELKIHEVAQDMVKAQRYLARKEQFLQ